MTDLPVSPRVTEGRWTSTWNMKFGTKIWFNGRPMFAVIAGVEDSRVTPDDPVPQWQKCVDAVIARMNEAASQPRITEGIDQLIAKWRKEAADRRAECGQYDEYAAQQEHDADDLEAALVTPRATEGVAQVIATWRAYVQHKPECAALQCSHCGGLLAAHRPTGRHAAIGGPCTCGFADLEAALASCAALVPPQKEQPLEHHCGLMGWNPMIDPPCPACEGNRIRHQKEREQKS